MIEHYDIAIIGAGPSGCACALSLHQSGLKVILIEKDAFPRDKICGDAIPGPAFKVMDKINGAWGKAMRQFADKADVTTSKVYASSGKSLAVNWVTYAYNSKRQDFDTFLFRLVQSHTPTTILENKRLTKIEAFEDGVTCQFEDKTAIKAALVIGCDGAYSVVTRHLGQFDLKGSQTCVSVRAYFKNVADVEKGVNEFHFFKEYLPGYFWVFPLENGYTNVGFGILSSGNKRTQNINLRETLKAITTSFPSVAARFKNAEMVDNIKGFALPLGLKKRPVSGTRFMLCGDAAALIDPLQGHGIDKAMLSGHLAALQAMRCFERQDFSADFMQQYDTALYDKIGWTFFQNKMAMKFISRFPFTLDMLLTLGKNQKLVQTLVKWFKI